MFKIFYIYNKESNLIANAFSFEEAMLKLEKEIKVCKRPCKFMIFEEEELVYEFEVV